MQDFRDLKEWQISHDVTLRIYRLTASFPRSEAFNLTSQIKRSGTSVGSLIAEGCGRGSDSGFARFLRMAMGSASEAEYQLLLSRDLGYVDADVHDSVSGDLRQVKRLLAALITRLKAGSPNGKELTADS